LVSKKVQNVPVYVVSLRRATERRQFMEEHLRELGIEYAVIDAVRGDALDPDCRKELNPAGNLSPAEVGCYLSHVQIYERMIKENIPVALILEDDIVLHHSVKTLLFGGCQSLDFDYCFLGCEDFGDEGYAFYDSGNPIKLSGQHQAYLLSSGPYCLFAYLITLEGAEKRKSCALPARAPIDHYHFLPYKPRFTAIIPPLAFINEQSYVDSMSGVTWSALRKEARRRWWYYPFRDIVKLKALKKLLAIRRAKFPRPGRWRPFESTLKVVPRKRYADPGAR
jgi:glycosyl transferase family 25